MSWLSAEEVHDSNAKDRALKPEIDWYRKAVDDAVDTANVEGKTGKHLKRALQPVFALVHRCITMEVHF